VRCGSERCGRCKVERSRIIQGVRSLGRQVEGASSAMIQSVRCGGPVRQASQKGECGECGRSREREECGGPEK
jgi:hypothetical protein